MTRLDLVTLLRLIEVESDNRANRIRAFQEFVHFAEAVPEDFDANDWDILTSLALDLDYYVADPDIRREDPSYYGDERLRQEIRESLLKLSA